jgi:hypothetical protein
MYVNMFSKIVQTLNLSFSALVATYRYNFANVLAANIRDDVLREKTLSDLALAGRTPAASGAASETHHVTANSG